MIKTQYAGQLYSGDFTGDAITLPVLRSATPVMLKPTIGINAATSGTPMPSRTFKLRGLYCETV